MNKLFNQLVNKQISLLNVSFNIIVFSLIALLVSLLTQCTFTQADNRENIKNVKTEERILATFNKIDINGAFEIIVTQAETQSVKIIADEKLLPEITTEVKDNTLQLSLKKYATKTKKIIVTITAKEINQIKASGACSIKSDNTLSSQTLELNVSGATSLNLNLDVESLISDLSGASEIRLNGNAYKNNIELSGATDFDALKLMTQKTAINISGAGNAKINVTDELIVDASGVSNIFYSGNPSKKQINTTGLSTIKNISK